MAWTDAPTDTDEWFRYDKFIQVWKAIEERSAVASAPFGRHNWPPASIPWYTGTVPSGGLTATTLTDAAQTWSTVRASWHNYDPPGDTQDHLPRFYNVVFDPYADEAWGVVKTPITAEQVGNVLTFADISDHVTAGYIPSIASLEGKPYVITTGSSTSDAGLGLWWPDRIPPYPNDRTVWRGTVTRGSAVTLTETHETIGDRAGQLQNWMEDVFVGKDLLTYGSDGRLHREVIGSNTIDTINWAGTTPANLSLEFANTIVGPFSLAFDVATGKYEWSSGADYFTIVITGESFTGEGSWTDPATTTVYTTSFAGSISARVLTVTAAGTYGATVTGEIPDHWYPTGNYVIVESGDRAWPGRDGGLSHWDYGGYRNKRASRYPGSVGMVDIAAASIRVMEFNTSTMNCELGPSHPVLDIDYITRDDEGCEPYDKFWAPDLYKTPRGAQVAIRSIAPQFIEAKTYHAQDDVHKFTLAEWWKKADVNWGTSTVQGPDGSGDYFFTVDTKYIGWAVAWTILNTEGTVAATEGGSFSPVAAAGKVTLGGAEWSPNAGKSIVYSAGETRRWPRAHRWMFPFTGFVADIYTAGGQDVVKDPPGVVDFAVTGSLGVGTWHHRAASTTYAEYSQHGELFESATAFVSNEASMYEGDQWPQGTLGLFSTDDSGDLELPYWHAMMTTTHPAETQRILDRQLTGMATGGSTTTLIDSAENWWSSWYDTETGSVLHIESGTATAGGTNSLTDAAKDITTEAGQFWIVARYNGFTAPYVGFVVEVELDPVNVPGVYERRVITGCTFSGNVPTITWNTALPDSAAGKPYRIREPAYTLNRWQGRRVKLTWPDGDTITATIGHSDDITLYFTEALARAVTANVIYEILEPKPGTIWQFKTAEPSTDRTFIKIASGQWWVQPVGEAADDSPRDAGDPAPQPWEVSAHHNMPTVATGYGLARRGDIVDLAFWQERYRELNALRWTEGGGTYYASADDAVPENNTGTIWIEDGYRTSPDDSDERAVANSDWAAASPWTTGSTMPMALTSVSMNEEWVSIEMDKVFAYYEPQNAANFFAHKAEILIYAGVDFVDTPVSDDQTPPELSTVEFKANGSGTLYHKFASMDELSVAAGATTMPRVMIGTALSTPPEFGRSIPISDTPPELGYTDQVTAGWYPVRTLVINKWDVTGGFTYVD